MFSIPEAHVLSDEQFKVIAKHLKKVAGIHLSDGKRVMVETRLQKRLRKIKCDGYDEYIKLLMSLNSAETRFFIDALTTNETYFFREQVHYDFISGLFDKEWSRNSRFKCWSAAASYGQEAYSLAMLANEKFPMGGYKVMATDISETALEMARKGEFEEYDYRMVPPELLEKYTERSPDPKKTTRKVVDKIKSQVKFQQANLLDAQMPFADKFDLIFLRNVLIYFEMEHKLDIVRNVLRYLTPGGYMIISVSEAPLSREICKITPLENLGRGMFHLPKK